MIDGGGRDLLKKVMAINTWSIVVQCTNYKGKLFHATEESNEQESATSGKKKKREKNGTCKSFILSLLFKYGNSVIV